MSRVCVVLCLALAACGAVEGPPPLPEGTGRGLTHADEVPPSGAATWQRPIWRVGDAFTLVRGDVVAAQFVVEAVEPDGYVVRGPGGVQLRRDRDLGNLGEWEASGDEPMHLLSPVDVRFHWPLWVGKRWRCEFVDRARGGPAMPMEASYEVEDLDSVVVPAGTYDALRIVRTLRLPGGEGRVLTRTQVVWYAPSIGVEVRQILADTEVELVEWRAGPQ